MKNKIYPFGDSHWRVFFNQVNHFAQPWTTFDADENLEIIDTTSNELSGATMYGLLKEKTTHNARRRILDFISSHEVNNIGLAFGEVDCRYHIHRFVNSKRTCKSVTDELADRYVHFIMNDISPKVSGKIFVYFGYRYTRHAYDFLSEKEKIHESILELTKSLEEKFSNLNFSKVVPIIIGDQLEENNSIFLKQRYWADKNQDAREVHLHPSNTFYDFIYPRIKQALNL